MSPSAPVLRETVGAVVVTYFPDDAFEFRLRALAREAASILVIDNSAEPPTQQRLEDACRAARCEFRPQPENAGLAAALNTGFSRLFERGALWGLAFDQDSTPEAGYLDALAAALAGREERIAAIGGNWRDEARPGSPSLHLRRHPWLPWFYRRRPVRQACEFVTCTIASGTLFHLPTWRELGGFDASLFLDLVDSDYCLRASQAGYPVCIAERARLWHRRGAKQPVRFLGRTFWPAFMPPARLRGLARNRLRLVPRHLRHAPHWVAFEFVYAVKLTRDILLLENGKRAKLAAFLRGTWEGLLGRSGPIR